MIRWTNELTNGATGPWIPSCMEATLKRDMLNMTHGEDHCTTHPQGWPNFTKELDANEHSINREFLQDTPQVTECCYWACPNPQSESLMRCTGCGIAKYCCKEHQQADWKWEHKGECRLPAFLQQEYAKDRSRDELVGQ